MRRGNAGLPARGEFYSANLSPSRLRGILNASERHLNSKVAEALHINDVKSSELLTVFLSFFKQARGLTDSVIRYGEASYIDVEFDPSGKIKGLVSCLTNNEIGVLSEKIKNSLIANQRQAVAQTVCFATSRAVRGTYRYKDVFQIVPIPSTAPHAPAIIADHPLLLQFSYVNSPHPTVNSKRRVEKTAKLTRLLGVVCRPPVFSEPRYARFFWNTSFDPKITAKWLQQGYGYEGFAPELSEFSDFPTSRRIRQYPSTEYYSDRFMTEDYEFALPNIMDEYLDKVFSLGAEDERRFAIASSWIAQVPALWMESSSAAFVAVVSAAEALLGPKGETCAACGQPKFGISKAFKAFLEEYVPDIRSRYPLELKQIYRIRSGLAHGAGLLLADLEYWNFYGDLRHASEDIMQRNTHNIGAEALRNWVLRR